ncbi:MAG: hypothetical protein HN793_01015 [Rhodospirillaceae bacterium]|nr:hypothetical protein [Rhodospirillaceae bacterium]MBT5240203.1 hypothetical protein [Rhodospirillaceae bacterium]MBT5566982.1 hypothetical protein [Rhodospirillaceae bacterium]MBT6090331.1 hypothetical protein [Rhodospirillaceae bacterium]MBT6961974.1 hypothetical protein [Rhodospirillaceae bacterium]
MPEIETVPPDPRTVQLVYVLYLLSLFFGPIVLAGLAIAYGQKSNVPALVKDHYRFQIRSAWIYMLFGVLIVLPALFVLGLAAMGMASPGGLVLWLCGFAVFDVLAWWIIRNIRGLILAAKGKPIPDPKSWAFGG